MMSRGKQPDVVVRLDPSQAIINPPCHGRGTKAHMLRWHDQIARWASGRCHNSTTLGQAMKCQAHCRRSWLPSGLTCKLGRFEEIPDAGLEPHEGSVWAVIGSLS